jgi:hypothetical protein
LPRIAAEYIPIPKKAAEASDTYPVGPENKPQANVKITKDIIVIKRTVTYIELKNGTEIKPATTINATSTEMIVFGLIPDETRLSFIFISPKFRSV